ncbi:MAG: glutamate 5-kinase [Syntrophomonadaceae bacterium]|nr:glutamate 5-kinase [Syntrophomonadaceae bacterium]
MEWRSRLKDSRRIVIKVGTSTLTYPNGKANYARMESLVREIADLHNRGIEVVLVSSGAIGTGANRMGLADVPRTLPQKQALAAIGQGVLLHMYEKLFGEYHQTVAQVLLTREDLDERLRYLNATNTLLSILNYGVIPIINENDTVVVEEIKFGDNDTLSSLVAGLVDADLLIILSDVDGLYDADPRGNEDAALLSVVEAITEDMEEKSRNRGFAFSSGGMLTKLHAARVCMSAGIPMVVANSSAEHVLNRILAGEELGTLFVPRDRRMHAREKWISFGAKPQGSVVIDEGAANALTARGKSLLPSGVQEVQGEFERGAVIAIRDRQGKELARGLSNYSAAETRLIAGKQCSEIETVLGDKDYDEVIHRNTLWVGGN